MHVAIAKLESVPGSPLSMSRVRETPRNKKEREDVYEERTWREKSHFDGNGNLYIPPGMFKGALVEAAKMLSMQIPGKNKSTYTKHFLSGVQVYDSIPLGIHKDAVGCVKVFCHSDGSRRGGNRVVRWFPEIPEWSGTLDFYVVDSTITEEVFHAHLEEAGRLVGIGRWRARVGGMNGRFIVKSIKWTDQGPM